MFLEKAGLEHFDRLREGDPRMDYERLKQAMITRFDQDRNGLATRARLQNRRLKSGESIDTMFHEMRQVAGKIHMTDDEFLAAFLKGLPTHVSN